MNAPAEIKQAIRIEGMTGAEVELISPLGVRKGRRLSYRVETAARTIKLRLLDSLEAAEELERISADLDDAFVPIIRRHGRVTVEPWVVGAGLEGEAAGAIEPAAAILARLHVGTRAVATGDGNSPWLAAAESDLQSLIEAGLVEADLAARVRARLDDLHRDDAPACVIHRDFCPENMLIDSTGEIRVIDNEWLAVGPPALDLGRTFHRWPMDENGWVRFLAVYSDVAGEPQDLGLWMLVAGLFAARVAVKLVPDQLDRALAMIREAP
jgi:aminoglycoside phosphotransferase (APT) family kinase protein